VIIGRTTHFLFSAFVAGLYHVADSLPTNIEARSANHSDSAINVYHDVSKR
jgi:hypothetical protein